MSILGCVAEGCGTAAFAARAVLEENHTKGGRRSLGFNKIYFILFFFFFFRFLWNESCLLAVLMVPEMHVFLVLTLY